MDKLMQAVNELRGDLENQKCGVVFPEHRILIRMFGYLYLTQTSKVSFISNSAGNESLDYICTAEEFNNLVAELSAAEWIKWGFMSSYTIEDLRGKYVEVGTPECEVFLDACEALGLTWLDGDKPLAFKPKKPMFVNSGGKLSGPYCNEFQYATPFTPKPTWTIYNNDKPLSELSDEQLGLLLRHFYHCNAEIEARQRDATSWATCLDPVWDIEVIYRAKQKSERGLFIEKGLAVFKSAEVSGNVESLLGAMFDADFKAPKGGE